MISLKVIFVLIDGMKYDTALECMGFMNHLVEHKKASRYKIRTEMPTLSKPMYETILTGVVPSEHLITSNRTCRLSKEKSIFNLARDNNLTTAAAAYYWMSELYNSAPFDYANDVIQNDVKKAIQHGIFYFEDVYPDSHLIAQGEYLRKTYSPDFLLIHTMGVDDAGHKYGGNSAEYKDKVITVDGILSMLIDEWISDENTVVIVTADHGMTELGQHGGTTKIERTVPLYLIGKSINDKKIVDQEMSQLNIGPTVCKLLNIEPSLKMVKGTLLD